MTQLKREIAFKSFILFHIIVHAVCIDCIYKKNLFQISEPFFKTGPKPFEKSWFTNPDGFYVSQVAIRIPFNESLYKSNIIFVCNIFSPLGVLLNKQELEIKTGRPIMLTTFFSLCKAIPRNWKISMERKPVSYNVYIPPPILWLTRDKKGTQNIRKIWQFNKQIKLQIYRHIQVRFIMK